MISTTISGCSNNKTSSLNHSIYETYNATHQKLQKGYYEIAIEELKSLNKNYLFGPYSQQIQMDLIYAYYKSNNLLPAKIFINRFLKLNPTNINIDYVFYMRGLVDMALDDANTLQKFFKVNRANYNPEYAQIAFQDFMQLIIHYPNSKYIASAKKHLSYLKKRIARYNLSVIKYYYKIGAYVAVINRTDQMLSDFPDTKATWQALCYMEKAYRKLELNNQADQVAKIASTIIFK